jgi:hypothetical protein
VDTDWTGFANVSELGISAISTESVFSVLQLDPIQKRAHLAMFLKRYLQSPRDAFAVVNKSWQFHRQTPRNSIGASEVIRPEFPADGFYRLPQTGRFQETQNLSG